jgi:hypothetical protein
MAQPRATVQVEGARALRRQLKAAGVDMADLKRAHEAVGNLVANASRPKVPTGETRRLVGSLRAARAVGSATVRAGSASVPYARPIHWGWPARGIRPQRFLWDTAKATEDQWLDVYWREIDQILAQVTGGTD